MKQMNFLGVMAALALVVSGLVVAPAAQAQVRSEKRPDVLLIVCGVAAAALVVLLAAGGGSDGNERPRPVSP